VTSHRGVQRELARLTKDTPRFDIGLRTCRGRAYNLKAIAVAGSSPRP
jgi:hypothetical protein